MTEEITLSFDFDEDIWKASVDPVEIENIIMNLVMNAREAIHYSGTISVITRNVEVTGEDFQSGSELVPGKYVELIVEDNGVGMDQSTRERVFEPFFSQKLNGEGLGLGLTTVYNFVKKFHGQIKVKSAVNQGTRVSVFFPARESDSGTAVPRNASSTIIRKMGRNGQVPVVLLTEHDDIVRNSVRMILKRGGYQVHAAASAGEAIEIAKRHRGEIDLLLTDATLPDMTGKSLAQEMAGLIGYDRSMLMSAYPDEALRSVISDSNPLPFIAKPFRPADLLQKLFEILQAKQD